MNKYLLIIIALMLTACTNKNEAYYRNHPKELQKALTSCPQQSAGSLSCEELAKIARTMNALAMQLQYNPQGFGQKILALQETIAKQKLEVKKDPQVTARLLQNQRELRDLLAVVKWLESPES